jgi:hypothetical protein
MIRYGGQRNEGIHLREKLVKKESPPPKEHPDSESKEGEAGCISIKSVGGTGAAALTRRQQIT